MLGPEPSPDDIQVQLVFYSTFEHGPANGRPYGSYGRAEAVRALTHGGPTPILYVGLATDVLGRVPLMPLFLLGN